MPSLRNLPRLFGRRPKPDPEPAPDLSSTQAHRLAEAVRDASPNESEAKPPKPKLSDAAKQRQALLESVRRIDEFLATHAERTEHIEQRLEPLPAALDSVPELHRQVVRLTEVIHDHLTQVRDHDEKLAGSITALAEASGSQASDLAAIRAGLAQRAEAASQLRTALNEWHAALASLAEASDRTTSAVEQLAGHARDREERIAASIDASRPWLIALTVFAAIAAVGAVVTAIAVLAN